MVNFPTPISNCDSHSPAVLDFFLSSVSICSTMALLHCEILIMLLSQFPLTSYHIHNGPPHFITLLMTILVLIGTVFLIIWELFHGRTSHYQVRLHSSPWFSAACAAALVHRNHSFCLYQKDKSSESKVKFRQASNHCKRVLEAAKLAYPNKTKESSLPRNLALRTFSKLPIVLSTKVNLLYLFYSTAQRCCLLHLIKWNCFLKNFLRTLALMTQLSLYLFSLLELIWNCITFL